MLVLATHGKRLRFLCIKRCPDLTVIRPLQGPAFGIKRCVTGATAYRISLQKSGCHRTIMEHGLPFESRHRGRSCQSIIGQTAQVVLLLIGLKLPTIICYVARQCFPIGTKLHFSQPEVIHRRNILLVHEFQIHLMHTVCWCNRCGNGLPTGRVGNGSCADAGAIYTV